MRTDRRTDVKKLMDAFRNFAKAPKSTVLFLYLEDTNEFRVSL